MGIERVSTILKMADEANTSVIAFNCLDYSMVKSVITVAEELNKPVICMLYPNDVLLHRWTEPAVYAAMVRALAKDVKVPIGLHLDHSSDFEYIVAAIRDGFSSVMYDGSELSLAENIANTREVVKVAHVLGADVEAELGQVGFADTVVDQSNIDMYTKPDVVKFFHEETGCDSIAISIGSAHGFYKETPRLDIQRLKAINAATDVPLVLHGGSGIPEDQLEVAFREGINKFNVGTEFFWLYYETIKQQAVKEGSVLHDLPHALQEKLREYLRIKMQLCKM